MDFYKALKTLPLPDDAQTALTAAYERIKNNPEFAALRGQIESKESFYAINDGCAVFSEKLSMDVLVLRLVLLLACADIMQERFSAAGVDENIFSDSIQDISYKAYECHALYGIWGVEPFEWYQRFFEAKRFQLGRLQYETGSFPYDGFGEKFGLKKGDTVIYTHIPSGSPLTDAAVDESLKRAFAFYGAEIDNVQITSRTWMLYPPYREVFGSTSNLSKFAQRFEIIYSEQQPEFKDAWRVFNTAFNGDTSVLPRDTSLQRAFIKYIDNGGNFGFGHGIIKKR